jgi:hypothetical protein
LLFQINTGRYDLLPLDFVPGISSFVLVVGLPLKLASFLSLRGNNVIEAISCLLAFNHALLEEEIAASG